MADEKKDKPTDKPAPSGSPDPTGEIIAIIVGLFFLVYVLNSALSFLNDNQIFSSGIKGFTTHGILLRHSRPLVPPEYPNSSIVSVYDTQVYDLPDEKIIGTQKIGARGLIYQGPVVIHEKSFWNIDFDRDPDGWVLEENIAYLESEPTGFEATVMKILGLAQYLKLLIIIISIFILAFIYYLFRKINKLRLHEDKLLYPTIEKELGVDPRWKRILDHIESKHENDWRLAILEADIMLNDLLDALSLPGETIGEKLKAVEKSDFTTLDNAWEAHKIRNAIAHEGVVYSLNQREVRRVIELYRTVFEEFQMI